MPPRNISYFIEIVKSYHNNLEGKYVSWCHLEMFFIFWAIFKWTYDTLIKMKWTLTISSICCVKCNWCCVNGASLIDRAESKTCSKLAMVSLFSWLYAGIYGQSGPTFFCSVCVWWSLTWRAIIEFLNRIRSLNRVWSNRTCRRPSHSTSSSTRSTSRPWINWFLSVCHIFCTVHRFWSI